MLCCALSNAMVAGLAEQPLKVPLFTGTPLATDIVMGRVTDATTVTVVDAVFPRASAAATV